MSDNDSEDNDKIKLAYNGKQKEIDKPQTYSDLLSEFFKAFNEDDNKEFKFFYFDEQNKKKDIEEDVTESELYQIKILNCIEKNKDKISEKKLELKFSFMGKTNNPVSNPDDQGQNQNYDLETISKEINEQMNNNRKLAKETKTLKENNKKLEKEIEEKDEILSKNEEEINQNVTQIKKDYELELENFKEEFEKNNNISKIKEEKNKEIEDLKIKNE